MPEKSKKKDSEQKFFPQKLEYFLSIFVDFQVILWYYTIVNKHCGTYSGDLRARGLFISLLSS